MQDAHLTYSTKQSLPAAQVSNSTDVYDAGEAKKLFEGFSPKKPIFKVSGKVTAGAATQIQAKLVGADDAALTQNVVVIADTGQTAVIASGGLIDLEVACFGQTTAKRYYGVIYTMTGAGGTADVSAFVTEAPQSNMPSQVAGA